MKKSTIITIIVAIIAIAAIVLAVIFGKPSQKQNETASKLNPINSQEDLSKLISQVYEGAETDITGVETTNVELTDSTMVKSYTGLDSADNLEYLAVSEPLINARAYSVVVAKVKDGVNANQVAKTMSENVDMRKWICVSAEKLYATNSGNVVFLVMTETDMATSIYKSFKNLAGSVGEEYEKTMQEEELPPDTVTPGTIVM